MAVTGSGFGATLQLYGGMGSKSSVAVGNYWWQPRQQNSSSHAGGVCVCMHVRVCVHVCICVVRAWMHASVCVWGGGGMGVYV